MKLPEYSVKNPVTTLMMFFGVVMVGLVCIWQLPVDLLPEMDLPVITVMTLYEGAAPEDVEEKVTKTLERYLSTVPDLKHITSKSKEGISTVSLSFEWGTNLDARSNDVRDAVGMAKILLPEDIEEPRVLKLDISSFPIMVFGVTARESFPRLEEILNDEIVDPIKRLPGVGSAAVMSPLHRQVNVDLDRERLAAYSLTPLDVVRSITRENEDTPAGNIKMGLTDYLVRVPGQFKDVAPMKEIVLASRNGSIVRLSDVGTVEDDFQEITRHISINGETGGVIMVQKQSDANTVQVARAVNKRIREYQKNLPQDIRIISLMDSSEDISRAIRDLWDNLLVGGILTILVVWIFLRQWRATIIISLTIPFSLILAVIVMFFLGYTINMMSLFGMIIAVGMIVDNAIVILENITRLREEGQRPAEGAIFGASEVGMAITASTLTTVCIFFPILFVKGIIKIIFTQFAVIVIVVIMGSLFSALTLAPMLSSTLLKKVQFRGAKDGKLYNLSEKGFQKMYDFYGAMLWWALHHRKTVIFLALLMFGGSLLLVPFLGTEFMPQEDQALVQGTLYLPVGTRVEETSRVLKQIEQILRQEVADKERICIFTRCGTSREGMGSIFGEEGAHIGIFAAKLVPRVERSRDVKQIAAALRKRVESVRGVLGIEKYMLESGDPMAGLILGGEKPLTVNIIGEDMEETDRIAARIKEIAQNIPGAVDITISRQKGRPELWVNVNRSKASSSGLNVSDVGDTVRASIYGKQAGMYRIHGDEYDIFVRFREKDRSDTRDLLATPILLPSGKVVRTENMAEVRTEYGPVEIDRKDQGRIVNVTGNVYGRSLGEVVADIEKQIAKLDIPQGVEVIMAGQTTEQRESFFWLTLSIIVGIVLVYMVMASQFESLVDPFVVMFSVPFAFTGTIWFLVPFGHHISVIVFIGVLLLIGVVVNNAIVLVDYINILRARGLDLFKAVHQGSRTRLRPVLMTAFTTIIALVPMAFGKGQGAEVWNPLGLTVFGGLLVSTLVTLILVPTVYTIFEYRFKKK